MLGMRPVRPDHPRIRGEHYAAHKVALEAGGSSPHTRGAPRSPSSKPPGRADHPRIRGEHYPARVQRPSVEGSSPHTRGARVVPDGPSCRQGIIPAYAGSTSDSSISSGAGADHPRIRGEHLPPPVSTRVRAGIIPAYAGSTLGNPCNTKDRRRDYTSFPLPVTHPSGGGGS